MYKILFLLCIFILPGKNGKSLRRLCKFSGYWTLSSRKYSSSFKNFLWNLYKFEIFSTHLEPLRGNLCDIAQPYKLFTYQYLRFIYFYHNVNVFVVSFCYRWIKWHILPLSPDNNISISGNRSNFSLVFFKADCHSNPGAERKWVGSSPFIWRHIFQQFSITSASNNVLLWTCKAYYFAVFFIPKSLETLFALV